MNKKNNILWWSGLAILLLGLTVALFWWRRAPQVITLNDGTRLTLEITDERGRRIQTTRSNVNHGYYTYQLADLGAAKTPNVTLTLHQSRFVEFTVKPEKAGEN